MDLDKAKLAYRNQKRHAKDRRIGWEITFAEWCDWWGDDFDRRGRGPCDLQMNRIGDQGPYALWNIVKGTPSENHTTRGAIARNRAALAAKAKHEAALNAAMWLPSAPPKDERDPPPIGCKLRHMRLTVSPDDLLSPV